MHWRSERLGSLCDVLDSKRKPITKRHREAGPFPYYGATGILDHVAGYLFDEPLVLVGEDGAKWGSGESTAFAVQGKVWVNNHAHVLRPHRNAILDSWLIYHLNYLDLTPFVTGLTVPKLNQGNLVEIPVPIPSLEEQQRIVKTLDEAFKGIATAKANVEKNLRNARTLFESHLRSTFDDHNSTWRERTKAEVAQDCGERRGSREHSGAAVKPNWRLMALADACQIKPPKSDARTKLSADAEVSFLPMEDLGIESRIVSATQRRPLAAVVGSYTYFADGDVLLAKITPCFENGKLGIVSGLTNGIGFGSSEYHVLRPTSVLLKEWLYYFLSRDSFREEGAARMTGAVGHRRVPKEFIETCSIPVPPLVEQERIVGTLDDLRSKTSRLESLYYRKLEALDALRNALLHQAFSGQL